MTADLSSLKDTFWIYVAVAIPVTAICLLLANVRGVVKYAGKHVKKVRASVGWPEREKKEGKEK